MYKSELAKLAGVSPLTFRRYLATRRPILTAMGVSPFARKLPPPAVHYISEDYCIDIPDNTATLSNKTTTDLPDLTDYPPRQPIKTIHRGPVSPFPRDGDSRDVGKNIACPAIPKRHGSRRSSATPVCILPLGEGLGWGNASLLLSSRRRNVEENINK